MTTPSDAILNAIAILRSERDKIDAVIAQVSEIFGLNVDVGLGGAAPVENKQQTLVKKQQIVDLPSARRRVEARTPRKQWPRGSDSKVGVGLDDQSTRILAALRKTGRPMSVGDLATDTTLSYYVLGQRLTFLSAKRLVVITGETNAKRIALPASAKEVP